MHTNTTPEGIKLLTDLVGALNRNTEMNALIRVELAALRSDMRTVGQIMAESNETADQLGDMLYSWEGVMRFLSERSGDIFTIREFITSLREGFAEIDA